MIKHGRISFKYHRSVRRTTSTIVIVRSQCFCTERTYSVTPPTMPPTIVEKAKQCGREVVMPRKNERARKQPINMLKV
jgi:hypothetical protein